VCGSIKNNSTLTPILFIGLAPRISRSIEVGADLDDAGARHLVDGLVEHHPIPDLSARDADGRRPDLAHVRQKRSDRMPDIGCSQRRVEQAWPAGQIGKRQAGAVMESM
jgi:hypothetical protein